MILSGVKHESIYIAISELNSEKGYTIEELCNMTGIARSAFYKWKKREKSDSQMLNEYLADVVKQLYEEHNGILGYKRMTVFVNRKLNSTYNHKRIRRIMQDLDLKSVIRRKTKGCTRPSKKQMTAENKLNRNFVALQPNKKWVTDVTEFKYGENQKLYLSAIMDLYDRRIVAYKIGSRNDNELVFENFNDAVKQNPDAKPLFHSDRGYQYTSPKFRNMLIQAGMTQSMSRVGKCIDNGPMEGFWGIIKTEMYYLDSHFATYEELEKKIQDYIYYYNNCRYQEKLGCMTPMELNALAA